MARFTIHKEILTQTGKSEYKNIKVGRSYWFEANSTDEAINVLNGLMEAATYIIKIQNDQGYKSFYKAIKRKDGSIKVLNDSRV